MQKLLVTGGAGFIGSHLLENLVEREDFELIIFDNLSTGKHNVQLLKKLNTKLIVGNIELVNDLKKIPPKIDVIFHLAAMNRAPRSIKDPLKSNEVNITGTLNLLELARKNDSKFIFSSSSSVFGNLNINPRPENTNEFYPSHPYGLGKMASEYYCRLYNQLYDVDTRIIRYFSIFGPRQSPKLTYSAVIPKFINSSIKNKPLTIYGGKQSRNFAYVKDAVKATLLISLTKKAKYQTYQIGGFEEVTINHLADMIEKISGNKTPREYKDFQKGDIFKSIPEMNHLIDEFNFQPSNTFYETLEETYQWFRNNPNYF